jgi:diguanylate cyclase
MNGERNPDLTADRRDPADPADATSDVKRMAALSNVERVDWLLLALSTLYLLIGASVLPQPYVGAAAVASFGALLVALRLPSFAGVAPRRRLWLTKAAMILYVAVVASQTGGLQSPLVNLFVLPVVLAAVMLGIPATIAALVTIAASLVVLHGLHVVPGETAGGYALAVAAEFLPLALVGYLAERLAAQLLAAQQQIQELAERDTLTGLVNMRTFDDLLARQHAAASAAGTRFALLMVDIEGLRQINESYGYEAGNLTLRTVADALLRSLRNTDIASRYGGDEFAVFLAGASDESAAAVAQRLRNTVYNSLFPVAGKALRVTVGVGIASYPRDARSLRDLLLAADRRMRQDKELRRRPTEERV